MVINNKQIQFIHETVNTTGAEGIREKTYTTYRANVQKINRVITVNNQQIEINLIVGFASTSQIDLSKLNEYLVRYDGMDYRAINQDESTWFPRWTVLNCQLIRNT
jgi:hypothetical protein